MLDGMQDIMRAAYYGTSPGRPDADKGRTALV